MASYAITAGALKNTGLQFGAPWNRGTEVTWEAITCSTKSFNDDLEGSKLRNARHQAIGPAPSWLRIMEAITDVIPIDCTSAVRRPKGYASRKVVSCMLVSPEPFGMERNLHREKQNLVAPCRDSSLRTIFMSA